MTETGTDIDRTAAEKRLQADRDDQQREAAGVEVGRHHRFGLMDDAPTSMDAKKRKEREEDARRAMLLTLATQEQISTAFRQLNDLQERIDTAFASLEARMDALELRTAHMRDGTAIYRTNDGFCTSDGRDVDSADLQGSIPGNAATWDEYQALQEERERIARIQTEVIDPSRDKLESGDLTVKDLEGIQEDIGRSLDDLNSNFAANRSYDAPLIESAAPSALNLKPGF